ncbi:hypothetical protein JAAARDRAFT_199877 [Jaapia argillacea MUCL 33604]|uniref:Uncharacterized protein n=1 Tax=Jaapia argillacea MUCL 33604 TaxID=933084 RepID=A0A067P6U4_9AGAM|nr:hypothetical protein JAAARDRAFT_199877 [Jaapia argillacea MUCL 33604]
MALDLLPDSVSSRLRGGDGCIPAAILGSRPTEMAMVEIRVHTHSLAPTNNDSDNLPPTPESVVLAGEMPGPQIELLTSEPVAVTHLVEPAASADNSVPTPVPVESLAASEDVVEPTGILLAEASTPLAESEEGPVPTTKAPGIPAAPPIPGNEESETISAHQIFPAQSDLNVPQPTNIVSSVPEPQLEEALVESVVPHAEPEVTFADSVVPSAGELTILMGLVDHSACVDDSLIESTQRTPITQSSLPASATEEQYASEVVQKAPDHVTMPDPSPSAVEVPEVVDQPRTDSNVVLEPKISSMQPEIDQPTVELAPVVEAVAPASPVVHAEVKAEILEQPESLPTTTTKELVKDAPVTEEPEVVELMSVVVTEALEHNVVKVVEESTAVVNKDSAEKVADEPMIEVDELSILPLKEDTSAEAQKADITGQNSALLPAESSSGKPVII